MNIRSMSEADEPAVLSLLQDALAGGPLGSRTSEFFRWKHWANPFGRSPALVAELDGRIVGLRTFLRWEFASGDQTFRAVRAVDTATHPSAQGRGIFRALTTAALDLISADTDFVFNTPNKNSLPGYLRMGWEPVGEVPVAVRPLQWGHVAREVRTLTTPGGIGRAAPAVGRPARLRCPFAKAAHVLAAGDQLSGLVADAYRAEPRLHTRRNLTYLQWRYGTAPGLDYRAVAVESGGEIVGLAVGRPRQRGALAEFTLTELLVRPGDRKVARRLLRDIARCGCDHVTVHLSPGHPARLAARSRGYLTPPRRGMLLVARPFHPVQPDPRRLGSWRLSLGDLEVF